MNKDWRGKKNTDVGWSEIIHKSDINGLEKSSSVGTGYDHASDSVPLLSSTWRKPYIPA